MIILSEEYCDTEQQREFSRILQEGLPTNNERLLLQQIIEFADQKPTTATGMRQQAYEIARRVIHCAKTEESGRVIAQLRDSNLFLCGLVRAEAVRIMDYFPYV